MGGSATAPGISSKSRTGSTKGSFKRNGEVLGYAHFTPPARPAASREVMTSTAKASYKDPNEKQPIVKYDPNALRNRLPVVFEGAAKPFARFCQVRNNHTYDFMNPGNGAKPPGFNPYRRRSSCQPRQAPGNPHQRLHRRTPGRHGTSGADSRRTGSHYCPA